MLARPLLGKFCWGMSSAAKLSLALTNYKWTYLYRPSSQFSIARSYKPHQLFSVSKHEEIKSFEQLSIPQNLKEKLVKLFPSVTEIQRKTINIILEGHDLIGVARTGSGKTLAYGLPTLLKVKEQKLVTNKLSDGPIYLIMCPTRQLAVQIEQHLKLICDELGLKIASVYGGVDRFSQLIRMKNGVDVMIATPGRLLDFLNAGKFDLGRVQFLTLDEADRILEVGYEEQIVDIAKKLPKRDRQTTLFSATWQKKVQRIFSEYMKPDHEYIQVGDGEVSFNLDIKQHFELAPGSREKLLSLTKLMGDKKTEKFLVFINKKSTAEWLQDSLRQQNISSAVMSGDLTQSQRTFNLNNFKSGKVRVLIATDVASRGLDIQDVTHVINYDFPINVKTYIHRIGRTGRAGKQGTSIAYLDGQASSESIRQLIQLHQKHQVTPPTELQEFMNLADDTHHRRPRQEQRNNYSGRMSSASGEPRNSWRDDSRQSSFKKPSENYQNRSNDSYDNSNNTQRSSYNRPQQGYRSNNGRTYNSDSDNYDHKPSLRRRSSPSDDLDI